MESDPLSTASGALGNPQVREMLERFRLEGPHVLAEYSDDPDVVGMMGLLSQAKAAAGLEVVAEEGSQDVESEGRCTSHSQDPPLISRPSFSLRNSVIYIGKYCEGTSGDSNGVFSKVKPLAAFLSSWCNCFTLFRATDTMKKKEEEM